MGQVGAGGVRALQVGKEPMSMGEILLHLASKARVEAEDAQRLLLSALNGMAAVLLLQGDAASAVSTYRQVCPPPTCPLAGVAGVAAIWVLAVVKLAGTRYTC